LPPLFVSFFLKNKKKTLLFKHLQKNKTNPQALNLILVCGLVDFFLQKRERFCIFAKNKK